MIIDAVFETSEQEINAAFCDSVSSPVITKEELDFIANTALSHIGVAEEMSF